MATAQDSYLNLVSHPVAREIAGRFGLPRPAVLRRYRPGEPLLPGPVLVLGGSGADALAGPLPDLGLQIRRQAAHGERLGAIVAVLDEVAGPADLAASALAVGAALRELAPGGRIVTVSRQACETLPPAAAAARQGVEGLLRSLARELRGGATGNGILLGDGVDVDAPGVTGALRFLLSARSAYVDGQFLLVGSTDGQPAAEPERPLAGHTAVVTGAARGIGAAIAEVLRRDGADVVVVDVPAAGEQLAAVANRIGGTALQLDITRPDAGARIIEQAGRHGRIDIVVHNAGITRDKLLANMDAERWDAVLEVNLAAPLRLNEALLASNLLGPAPRIVCLASTSGIAGNRGQTNYAASKAGIIGMVRSSAPLLAARGGTINAVAPGFIETEMTARMPAAARQVARRLLPSLQQGGLPRDVAEAVAFLSGGAAAGINGQTLRVCGQSLVGA
ncbi:3-oxoacyl-ACP reductase [Arthrobacter sp. I2-34]|uniref:3-oxoacyl-ACP reductase n=1 Tax=Arthrobacter hankyongi TaxID=2904801 RepID=A0ABS9L6J6_9MICC|nr:3-oxoacyl-ACP reductase [Arthrobacter hankyongi]MCG2622109.1 3-oxoacyl-ACP reductase [Arthrobacter hankyongi]